MTDHEMGLAHNGFVFPGAIGISAAALKFAREFADTIKRTQHGDLVVTFSWAESISIRRGPNEPSEDIGACLTLGAFERNDIPHGFTQTVDGLEIAIKIPRHVWEDSLDRVIDTDETLLFKLALR